MKDEKKVPAIRFKGFTDAWEQREFLSCMDRIIDFRGRTPKKLGLEWSPSGYLALSALNVKDGYIDTAVDAHYANQELYDKWMRGSELKQGQVLFTTEAPMGNVAQVPDNKGYILSQRTIAFVTKDDLILDNFLATVLKSSSVFSKLESLTSGGTAKGISQKSLAKVDLPLPADLTEQQKISNLFLSLNCLITLHQRKYDCLVKLKKSLLEKMFPKNGSDKPDIRFKGFTDAWEQRELSRLAQRIVRKNNNLTTNLPLTISAEYGLVDQITYFNNRVASANLKNYYLIFNGEFAYNKSSSEGNPVGVIKRLDLYKNGALSTLYIIFSIKETSIINSDFLCIFFETSLWHKDIFDRAAEGARNHGLLNISAQDFLEMNIKFPQNLQEQIKIKSLLNKLNTLITLHQRKLEILQNLKKSLLEKMFV